MEKSKIIDDFIVSKTLEEFRAAKVFDAKISEMSKEMDILKNEVIQIKSENPDTKYTDVRDTLVNFHRIYYEQQVYGRDLERACESIATLYPIAKLYDLPLGLSDEEMKIIERISVDHSRRTHIVDSGKIIVSDQEAYDMLSKGMEIQINQEPSLEFIFNSESFRVKQK